MSDLRIVADGLRFPEGPVALPDGSVLVVEIAGKALTRIAADGSKTTVARLDGGPNGAALGPDGRCYVCNNGGMEFREKDGLVLPGAVAASEYSGGWIEAVDLATGMTERIVGAWRNRPLSAPNDIVFDSAGGFYFTDSGKLFRTHRDRGAVYYVSPSRQVLRTVFPMEVPNGVGLSPNGATLYVAETATARLWAYELTAPGVIRRGGGPVEWEHGRLVFARGDYALFDSLAVDAEGNICVTEIPAGRIVTISPSGAILDEHTMPDRFATNLCFGGPDLRTAFITLSSTGRLACIPWPRAGLKLYGA